MSAVIGRFTSALALIALTLVAAPLAEPAGAAPLGYAQILTLGGVDGSPSGCQLTQIDLGTGALQPIGATHAIETSGCPLDMALGTDGLLYGVLSFGEASSAPSQLVSIDPATGERTPIGAPLGFATNLPGPAFDGSGSLWYYAQTTDPLCSSSLGSSCLYRIDPATGVATYVATGAGSAVGATATCDALLANEFIETTDGPPDGRLVTIDTTDASFDAAPNLYTDILMIGLEYDAAGILRAIGFGFGEMGPTPPMSYTVDPATGIETLVAPIDVEGQVVAALAIAPLDCSPVAPVEVTPTFTG